MDQDASWLCKNLIKMTKSSSSDRNEIEGLLHQPKSKVDKITYKADNTEIKLTVFHINIILNLFFFIKKGLPNQIKAFGNFFSMKNYSEIKCRISGCEKTLKITKNLSAPAINHLMSKIMAFQEISSMECQKN